MAIYALSFGTYVLNAYLQIPGSRADVVVMDGPVPPQRWALENDPKWKSTVAQDVLRECVSLSPTCLAQLDIDAHAPGFLMDSVIDGSLPCLESLPWLTPYAAASYNIQMLQGPQHVVLGPFWARVQRCSESDIEQLNYYHSMQEASEPSGLEPPFYTYGISVAIGSSEVYSFAEAPYMAATYDEQSFASQRTFATAGVELLLSHARDVEGFPTYVPDPRTYRKFAQPTMPLQLLVGTLDPQTPYGLGPWFADGLGDASSLVTVPYATHGTVIYEVLYYFGFFS